MLALLFPGQGSQEVGMGRDAALASAAAREIFERADAVLGLPLSRICFDPSGEDELLRTEIQQPAILTVSVALLRALEAQAPLGQSVQRRSLRLGIPVAADAVVAGGVERHEHDVGRLA